ncbi:VOC family protein [Archangium lansingense]|uniref:VOC family protein n=1 Tax=Archangium lansingense TaxID=2995310 RepID=A0ABT4AGB4_9BACT|nr:VOC family protein [Archangium lansinium]MCY1080723.1 VOC family protein [Archangium lansinium]
MALEILELHHHGVCMHPSLTEPMREFYEGVLGLSSDAGRPRIPGIPGHFMDVPGDTQIHLLGKEGPSMYAQGPGRDPVDTHVALAVADVAGAERELLRLKVDYWKQSSVAAPQLMQLFFRDPAGNLIELHQASHCRCKRSDRERAA